MSSWASRGWVMGLAFSAFLSMSLRAVSSELGDWEGDGDVDLADYGLFQECFPAPGGDGPSASCLVAFDFDANAKIDELDTHGLIQAMVESALLQRMALRIGPVSGLTTAWHSAPPATAVPRAPADGSSSVEFMVIGLPPNATVVWTNAVEAERAAGYSRAQCTLDPAGPLTVSATASVPGIQVIRSIDLSVVDVAPGGIECTAIQVSAAPFTVTEDSSNGVTMQYWFGENSIAALTQTSPSLYHTSVDRVVTLDADLTPAAFTPLLEWRISGQPPRLAGQVTEAFAAAGLYAISVGPVAAPQVVSLQTYRVTIADPPDGTLVPEGQPVTFTAVTDPPGYAGEITWLSSTKYGTAEPTLGLGPTFTVQFDNTTGEQPDGSPFQWFGVRADNAQFSQGKIMGACCIPPYVGASGCVQNTESGCLAVGGRYQGDGTMCTMPQACCYPDGVCVMVDPLCCDEVGGTVAPGACAFETIGCCLPGGSCVDADRTCCTLMDGIPVPESDLCNPQACCKSDGICVETDPYCCTFIPGAMSAPGHCNDPLQGCCLPNGSCVDMNPACCARIPGAHSLGRPCEEEACCLDNGTCIYADPYCCENVYHGRPAGDQICSAPLACCFLEGDGHCSDYDPVCCEKEGGRAGPPGSMCTMEEACCFPAEQNCRMLDPECCALLGGVRQGPGTQCTVPEACCVDLLFGFECISRDPLCCAQIGGIPQGPNTVCGGVEACCLPDDSCIPVVAPCCDEAGAGFGSSQGPGSACSPVLEGCCLLNDTCVDMDALCCLDNGDVPTGAPCLPEACCRPDGSCVNLDPLCCFLAGWAPSGPGACLPEACCVGDGTCINTDPICCFDVGGTPTGPGFCDPPQACCLPDGSCTNTDPICCEVDLDGTPGDGPCESASCCLPDGSCIETDPVCCARLFGVSATGTCEPSACCMPDGSCQDLPPACCVAQLGVPSDPAAPCRLEGCCVSNGICVDTDPFCCEYAGGGAQGPESLCGRVACLVGEVDIDVDTDRDGSIENDDDEAGENTWAKDRGAFFFVNCNDDDDDHGADGLEFDAAQDPENEDLTINGTSDVFDITPFVVRILALDPATDRVELSAPLDQIKCVHVFDDRTAGAAVVWGGPTEANNTYDITHAFAGVAEHEFGLEGLNFRLINGASAAFPAGHPMLFEGLLHLTVTLTNGAGRQFQDEVELKVAPFIMLPNTQPSIEIFARDSGANNAAFRAGLDESGQLITYSTDTQWAQDPLEIGFTETPLTWSAISAYTLHQGNDPGGDVAWRRELLLSARRGIYRNPNSLPPDPDPSDSGDFGGNLELLPPTNSHRLGRMCFGETMSARKRAFLESQEVQPPFALDTRWLEVGHVDEIVGFYSANPHQVIIASPRKAYTIMCGGLPCPVPRASDSEQHDSEAGAGGLPPDEAVFFGLGESRGGLASGGDATHLYAQHDFGADPTWQYVRIYAGTGEGQVAHVIDQGFDQQIGFLEIDQVWQPFDVALSTGGSGSNCAGGDCTFGYNAAISFGWTPAPDASSKFVVVQDSLFWNSGGSPRMGPLPGPVAVITVGEVTRNATLQNLNIQAQIQIDNARRRIRAAMGGDPVTFIEVPVIYTSTALRNGLPLFDPATGGLTPRTAVAWSPGLANVQMAGGKVFFAKQNGPRFTLPFFGDVEFFELDVVVSLGFAPVFVDDFEHYHKQMGEVHCGSNVLRERYDFPWWERQP